MTIPAIAPALSCDRLGGLRLDSGLCDEVREEVSDEVDDVSCNGFSNDPNGERTDEVTVGSEGELWVLVVGETAFPRIELHKLATAVSVD